MSVEFGLKIKMFVDGYPLPSIGAFFTIFQFLATWSLMYPFLPSAYLYHYTITTLMFLWAMYDETSAQSCFLLAVLQALGFILDIFALSFHFQDSKNNSQLNNRFDFVHFLVDINGITSISDSFCIPVDNLPTIVRKL